MSSNVADKIISFKIKSVLDGLKSSLRIVFKFSNKNSSLSIGASANYYSIDFAPSSGVSGDGSDGIDGGSVSSLGFNSIDFLYFSSDS